MPTREAQLSFADFLVTGGHVQQLSLKDIGAEGKHDLPPEEVLRRLKENGAIDDITGAKVLAQFYKVPFVHLKQTTFDPSALAKLSPEMVRQYRAVPFYLCDNELSVAFETLDISMIDTIRELTKCEILTHLTTSQLLDEAIAVHYFSEEILRAAESIQVSDLLNEAVQSQPIKDLSEAIIVRAIRERASDIHIEPCESTLRIRFRVDGRLREEFRLPVSLSKALVARFKVLAELDIAESRHPQDGRYAFPLSSRHIDLRLSFVPSRWGEKLVMRILDKMSISMEINDLYLSTSCRAQVEQALKAPHGLLFVTGPTGSGKSTTCYALVDYINNVDRNIVTVENPIEYDIIGATQIQVRHDIGLGFAELLRSVLRQDPDVVLVGEIRDLETAVIAVEAGLTGHLVLATLHTNDAVQAVMRLVEMGVEPFLVAPTLIGVMAQRLVRRICRYCGDSYEPDERERALLGCTANDDVKLRRGRGCEACRQTGFLGRVAIHEFILVTPEIRTLIMNGAHLDEIARAAKSNGYRPMHWDGYKKAMLGLTTLEEVERATPFTTSLQTEGG